jgi:4-hydroxybenzoate polyprenyltransferase
LSPERPDRPTYVAIWPRTPAAGSKYGSGRGAHTQFTVVPMIPLYVDLDGTVLATDTLWESVFANLKSRPGSLPAAFSALGRGKAQFKEVLAEGLLPDIATLPVRPEVIAFLQTRRAQGQPLILATGADRRIAEAIAARLGIFDAVLASDGATNLIGEAKLSAIRAACPGEFDYLGDSTADLPLFGACREAFLAGGSRGVAAAANRRRGSGRPITLLPPADRRFAAIRAMRPHQWVKNLLIGIPIIVSHKLGDSNALFATAIAFAAFSALASSVYLFNDLLDLPSDRIHARKKNRALASGAVSIPAGIVLCGLLFAGGLGLAAVFSNREFLTLLALYFLISSTYSVFLKKKLLVDVFVLAGLYTIRIIAGSAAIGVRPSEWLLAFSIFIFTSLAMLKRYVELHAIRGRSNQWTSGRGYHVSDIDLFRTTGIAAAYAAVLIFCLYINSPAMSVLYRKPYYLWLVCGILLYWLSRLWFLTNRNRPMDDPVLFAITDRASIFCGAVCLALVYLAT